MLIVVCSLSNIVSPFSYMHQCAKTKISVGDTTYLYILMIFLIFLELQNKNVNLTKETDTAASEARYLLLTFVPVICWDLYIIISNASVLIYIYIYYMIFFNSSIYLSCL